MATLARIAGVLSALAVYGFFLLFYCVLAPGAIAYVITGLLVAIAGLLVAELTESVVFSLWAFATFMVVYVSAVKWLAIDFDAWLNRVIGWLTRRMSS